FTDGGSADTHTVTIDWKDGSPLTSVALSAGVYTFSASHQYLDDNPTGTPSDTYTVRVRVLDNTPDLLVVNDSTNEGVYRYDGTTGAFEGVFIPSGGVLISPQGIAI